MPLSIFRFAIEITTMVGCKNTCSYCPQERFIRAYMKRSNVTQMSFDTFKVCLDKMPPYGNVRFSGMCEPWLNPQCTDMVLYAYKNGHKIAVFTTLVGMNPSDIDLLDSIPFGCFAVHLPSAEGYEKINVDETYLNVLNKLLKSNIKATYHSHSKNIHPKLRTLIKDNVRYVKWITRAGNIKIENLPYPERQKGAIRCTRNLRHNILLPNGDVILCCMDWGMKHVLGNLISSDYVSLLRGKEFLRIKKGLRDESLDILCRHCSGAERFSFIDKIKYYSNIERYIGALIRLGARLLQRKVSPKIR